MTQDHNHIIVFQRYGSAIDANIAKSKLDAYGVPCFLTEENMANLYPGASSLMNSNVRLHLFEHDAERAQQIMTENNLLIDDDSILACPRCRSRNIASSLRVLFFGIFFPDKKVYRCSDCDFEF